MTCSLETMTYERITLTRNGNDSCHTHDVLYKFAMRTHFLAMRKIRFLPFPELLIRSEIQKYG